MSKNIFQIFGIMKNQSLTIFPNQTFRSHVICDMFSIVLKYYKVKCYQGLVSSGTVDRNKSLELLINRSLLS